MGDVGPLRPWILDLPDDSPYSLLSPHCILDYPDTLNGALQGAAAKTHPSRAITAPHESGDAGDTSEGSPRELERHCLKTTDNNLLRPWNI
ncbi:unnamed protein product, partial [Mesorhabditis spiculigera]